MFYFCSMQKYYCFSKQGAVSITGHVRQVLQYRGYSLLHASNVTAVLGINRGIQTQISQENTPAPAAVLQMLQPTSSLRHPTSTHTNGRTLGLQHHPSHPTLAALCSLCPTPTVHQHLAPRKAGSMKELTCAVRNSTFLVIALNTARIFLSQQGPVSRHRLTISGLKRHLATFSITVYKFLYIFLTKTNCQLP